jgi:predicted ArsR family transcriptional regulator
MSKMDLIIEEKLREQRKQMRAHFGRTLVSILRWLEADLGTGVAESWARRLEKVTITQWASVAESEENHTIQDLIRLLWEPLKEEGWEYSMEEDENGVRMCCTKCAIADFAKDMASEEKEWVFRIYCASDPFITEGFNPQIGFQRTKTLVEGFECCDHYYYMK